MQRETLFATVARVEDLSQNLARKRGLNHVDGTNDSTQYEINVIHSFDNDNDEE